MAVVNGLTAAKMQAIANASITQGAVNGSGHLILTNAGGSSQDAGSVVGPQGPQGVKGDTGLTGQIGVPGTVVMFAGFTVPTGWLLCSGQAVSRTTFSTLFSIIGTSYGAGNGTTTFNVPNMQARYPRMDSSNPGATGGSDSHSHTIVGHDHDLVNGSPQGFALFTMGASAAPNAFASLITTGSWNASIKGDTSTASSSSTASTSAVRLAGNTSAQAGFNSGTTNNDPPYLNMNFIIKT